jgi:hypothetical protein
MDEFKEIVNRILMIKGFSSTNCSNCTLIVLLKTNGAACLGADVDLDPKEWIAYDN